LENRVNVIGFDKRNSDLNVLRQDILYYEFPYPVFKLIDVDCKSIVQIFDHDKTLIANYQSIQDFYTNFNKGNYCELIVNYPCLKISRH